MERCTLKARLTLKRALTTATNPTFSAVPKWAVLNAVGCSKTHMSSKDCKRRPGKSAKERKTLQTTRFETTKFRNSQCFSFELLCRNLAVASLWSSSHRFEGVNLEVSRSRWWVLDRQLFAQGAQFATFLTSVSLRLSRNLLRLAWLLGGALT